MIKLLVIADDLTGALDTGVQLAKKGIPTEVRIPSCGAPGESGAEGEHTPDTAVVVIDTESRHLPPEEAFTRARNAALWGKAAGAAGFYKKTDSTLRGNIGAELAGLMDACPRDTPLIFAPAFPALKRTTRLGVQYVDGVSLEKTAFARDRLNPITTANIAEIITTGARGAALKVYRAAPEQLAEVLGSPGAEKTLTLVDGEKEEDLAETSRQIQAAINRPDGARPLPLMAGCAGFAAYLPELLGIIPGRPPQPKLSRPFLAVNGSLNPVSLSQIRAAAAAGVKTIRIEPKDLKAPSENVKIIAEKIKEHFTRREDALLYNILDPREAEDFTSAAAALGIPEEKVHEVLPQTYGTIVHRLVSDTPLGILVVFGGDTLVGILKALGKNSVIPAAEIFPGVVIARIPGIDNPRYILTKAGGFGDENLLRNILTSI
jgi:uncharacterized protein YgbK (DUF1537 family)